MRLTSQTRLTSNLANNESPFLRALSLRLTRMPHVFKSSNNIRRLVILLEPVSAPRIDEKLQRAATNLFCLDLAIRLARHSIGGLFGLVHVGNPRGPWMVRLTHDKTAFVLISAKYLGGIDVYKQEAIRCLTTAANRCISAIGIDLVLSPFQITHSPCSPS